MLEPQYLTTLWASKACYRDSFTFFTCFINCNRISEGVLYILLQLARILLEAQFGPFLAMLHVQFAICDPWKPVKSPDGPFTHADNNPAATVAAAAAAPGVAAAATGTAAASAGTTERILSPTVRRASSASASQSL